MLHYLKVIIVVIIPSIGVVIRTQSGAAQSAGTRTSAVPLRGAGSTRRRPVRLRRAAAARAVVQGKTTVHPCVTGSFYMTLVCCMQPFVELCCQAGAVVELVRPTAAEWLVG